MQENNLKEKTIKRPWQANAWLLILSFGLIGLVFGLFSDKPFLCPYFPNLHSVSIFFALSTIPFIKISLIFASIIFSITDVSKFFSLGIVNLLLFILLVLFIFSNIYLILGFLKGIRFRILLSVVFSIIEFFLSVIFYFLLDDTRLCFSILLFSLIIMLFSLYLQYSCLKHPFYNQKKVEQKS